MQTQDARYYREDRPNVLPHVVEAFGEKVRFRSEKQARAFLCDVRREEA